MAKRGNNIYHRADGRWEGRYYCKGSHKYRSVYGKSYTEAKEKLDKLRSEVLVPSARCILLVSDIMKMWLEAHKPSIKESSYAVYRHKLEKHIIPYFEKMKYNRLDLGEISKFVTDKLSDGLSAKYISDMVIMIKGAAKWAEITHNYADLIKDADLPKKKIKETAVFTQEEQKKIITTAKKEHTNTSCGVVLTMFTGMRIGEACALKWADIDFNNKVLHISKTVQRMHIYGAERKTVVKVTTPKSETSVRDIPLPDFIMDMLREFRGNDNEYILSGTEQFVEPRTLENRYKAMLKRAGVAVRKYHVLRHTFAVMGLEQNFDIKTLSEILGHSNAVVTLKVYAHSSMERKSACMNRLQALA